MDTYTKVNSCVKYELNPLNSVGCKVKMRAVEKDRQTAQGITIPFDLNRPRVKSILLDKFILHVYNSPMANTSEA